MRAGVLLLVMVGSLVFAVQVVGADALAGPQELAQVEQQILVMRGLIAEVETRKGDNQGRGVELLYQTARHLIATWTDYQVAGPKGVDELGAWYMQAMRDRRGFDVLEPVNPWMRGWIELRKQEHALQDQYEELRISLRHLERLRDRLRVQLNLSPRR